MKGTRKKYDAKFKAKLALIMHSLARLFAKRVSRKLGIEMPAED